MTFEIQTDNFWRPKPRKKRRQPLYPFHLMKPGQFFVLAAKNDSKATVRNRINQSAMRAGVFFDIRRVFENDEWFYRVYHDGYIE